MIEEDIAAILHRLNSMEMKMRNPCADCYYRKTYFIQKPRIESPTELREATYKRFWGNDPPRGDRVKDTVVASQIAATPSPETSNKFHNETKFVVPVVDDGSKTAVN